MRAGWGLIGGGVGGGGAGGGVWLVVMGGLFVISVDRSVGTHEPRGAVRLSKMMLTMSISVSRPTVEPPWSAARTIASANVMLPGAVLGSKAIISGPIGSLPSAATAFPSATTDLQSEIADLPSLTTASSMMYDFDCSIDFGGSGAPSRRWTITTSSYGSGTSATAAATIFA